MKSSLALLALLLASAAIPGTSKAQGGYTLAACIKDDMGNVWNVTVTHKGNFYTGVGNVDVGAGYLWDATITYDESEHTTTFKAVNPKADACASGWVDYFTYKGRANAKKLGQDAAYNGHGSFKSYCSGTVVNVGDWTATDCASAVKISNPGNPAKAANSEKSWDLGVCIRDDAGYVWTFTAYYNDHGTWFATGSVDLGDGSPVWDAKGKYQPATHETEFEATNLNPDGCTIHTDAFRYEGTAKAKNNGGVVTYNGSGTWTSYCGGSEYATGTWSATDCDHKGGAINPIGAGKVSNSQKVWDLGVCIHDDAGYVWTFTAYNNDHGTWFATGTVDLGDGSPVWDAKGKYQPATHETEFEATNPNSDGCTIHTDGFRYEGTAKAKNNGGVVTYNGSGTWTSYCGGSEYATGTWSATDCDNKGGIANPNGAGKASGASFVKVSPNPIIGQANVSYAIARAGQVNITVYNSMQQAVKVLVNGYRNAGSYSTVWDTRSGNLNSGIYRVVAVVNGRTYTTTVQVVK
ncbi:MAG TPA: hypothetical protein VEV83_17345 [Parafilimonas sp.]|nr:hypothetical protein [Parafilimonas sp.]